MNYIIGFVLSIVLVFFQMLINIFICSSIIDLFSIEDGDLAIHSIVTKVNDIIRNVGVLTGVYKRSRLDKFQLTWSQIKIILTLFTWSWSNIVMDL